MTLTKKRTLSLLSLLLSIALLVSACDGNNAEKQSSNENVSESGKISVVTSFYPIYFLTEAIGGESVQVTNLIASGVEPHDWSPKSKDLLTASNADLLIYHGAGFETWIDDFKDGLDTNSHVVVKEASQGISLIDTTKNNDHAQEEDTHDDHAHEEDTHDDHANEEDAHDDHAHEEEHTHSHSIDPHTWVSPKSAIKLAENIKNALVEISTEHKDQFEANYNELMMKLEELDQQYEQQLAAASNKHFVVSHQSFGYVARDYGLEQISIMGINPNSEPRAQDILDITKLVQKYDVKYIFFEELVSDKLAKMLAAEAKVDTMMLYSLEGLTTKQEKAGETYLTLMERNLQNLVEALQ